MDILESVEVRWFFAGAPAAAVIERWFAGVPSDGERTDHYLVNGRSDYGFKARLAKGAPAKAETKLLLGSLGAVEVAPNVSGIVERWQKLSLAVEDPALRKDGEWLALAKDRLLRKFAWRDGAVADAGSTRPDAGAGFELTTLSGDSRIHAYTIGIEAFGPPPKLLSILLAVAGHVFGANSGSEFGVGNSMSYPGWLAETVARGR